jgi:TP901 family phage tail tape measure protein
MAAESNVGARIFLIGKDAAIAGYREVTAAVAAMNKEIAAGAKASKVAAAGYDEQMAGLEALGAKMDLYSANLARVNAETNALARLGKVAFFGLAAAGAAFGYESIKWAREYQTQLVMLRTQAGLTAAAVKAIGAAAMSNGAALGIGPATYVGAAYHPASAGFHTRTTIQITNAAGMLAGIGGANVETTVNAVTGIMRSYNMKGNQAKQVAALVNATIGAGNMHMATFNAAAGTGVYSTAKTFGITPRQVGAALAFLTDRNVPASQAGTHLRMTMALLGAPSEISASIAKQIGLTTTETSARSDLLHEVGVTATQLSRTMRNEGLVAALRLLKRHMAGLTQNMIAATLTRMFGGGRMGTTMMAFFNSITTLAAKTAKIEKNASSKDLMKDWGKYTGTLTYAMKRFDATIKTLGTSLGEHLIPPLTKVLGLIVDTMKWFDRNKAAAIGLASVVGAVLVPAIGVYLYRALLSSGGAIRTVITAYKRLILGQSEEQAAMVSTDAELGTNDAALGTNDAALAANDAAVALNTADLAANDAARGAGLFGLGGGALGLAGFGGAALGVGATLYGLHVLGTHANSVFQHQQVKLLKSKSAIEKQIHALKHQMHQANGGVMGDIESWGPFGDLGKWLTAERVPGLQNNTAGIEAKDKVLLQKYEAELHSIEARSRALNEAHQQKVTLGDFGLSTTPHVPPIRINNRVDVYIDGKEVTKAVTKRTRRTAARMR